MMSVGRFCFFVFFLFKLEFHEKWRAKDLSKFIAKWTEKRRAGYNHRLYPTPNEENITHILDSLRSIF